MTSTDISVVLCTYNGEQYLPELLDSLLQQTLLPGELVWRDDGSTDTTPGLAKEFAERAPFPVNFSVNARNLGPIQNFGHALSHATASRIALCDQDDVWLPNKLELLASQFEDPGTKMVYSDSLLVDSELTPYDQTLLEQRGTQHPDKESLGYLLFQNTVSGCVSMFDSELLPVALPIPDEAIMHDWWVTLVAAATGQVKYVPTVTTLYRQHDANVLGSPARWGWSSLRASGLPFGVWGHAGQKFLISANQAIALRNRLGKREIAIPEELDVFSDKLARSRVELWRSCSDLDIQRGDWMRNLYFTIGLLAYKKRELIEQE